MRWCRAFRFIIFHNSLIFAQILSVSCADCQNGILLTRSGSSLSRLHDLLDHIGETRFARVAPDDKGSASDFQKLKFNCDMALLLVALFLNFPVEFLLLPVTARTYLEQNGLGVVRLSTWERLSDTALVIQDFAAPLDLDYPPQDFEDLISQLERVIASAEAAALTNQDRRFAVGITVRAGAINVSRQLHVEALECMQRQIMAITATTTHGEQGEMIMSRTKKKRHCRPERKRVPWAQCMYK